MANATHESTSQIKSIIKDYIRKEFMYDSPDAEFDDDLLLMEQGIVDSMKVLRLITFLEQQFGFMLEPEEMVIDHFETLNAVTNLVQSRDGKKI